MVTAHMRVAWIGAKRANALLHPTDWGLLRRRALRWSMARLRAVGRHLQLCELGMEGGLVVEAAQIQNERAVVDAADDRDRQAAESDGQRLEATAGTLPAHWRNSNARAGQDLQRQRAGADLAHAV